MDVTQLAEHFGNHARAAKALGLARQTVSKWKAAGEIPLDRQVAIEVATEGALLADLPASVRNRGT